MSGIPTSSPTSAVIVNECVPRALEPRELGASEQVLGHRQPGTAASKRGIHRGGATLGQPWVPTLP